MLAAELLPGDHGRHLHGLADVHDVGDQVGEAHLDQAHHGGAGGGNEGLGQARLPQLFVNGAADDVRAPGHLEHLLKADGLQGVQHGGDAFQPLELAVQGGRGNGDRVGEAADGAQIVGDGDFGVVFADADAFTAVDAAFVNDVRPAPAHADGLRGAVLQAVGAALAAGFIQSNGMIPIVLFHIKSLSQARLKRMLMRVPLPTSL